MLPGDAMSLPSDAFELHHHHCGSLKPTSPKPEYSNILRTPLSLINSGHRRKINMSTQTLNYGNGKLPFDILGVIFRLYLDNESISYPLETVLLVCRGWHSTALAHKSLWSIFNITAAAQWQLDFWEKCISRRLLRSSRGGTIDIEIDSRDCSAARLGGIVSVLAGESGINVKRWRRLCLRTEFTGESFTKYLRLNTPNLQDLEIHDINTGRQRILPLTPLLRRFYTSRFPAPYPDLSGVTELTISGWKSAGEVDNDAILMADHVVTLSVEDYGNGFRLPREFPALRHLSLQGRIDSEALVGFSAPLLRTLAVSFTLPRHFTHIANRKGINLKNVEELKLGWWYYLNRGNMEQFISEIRGIMEAAVNVQILWAWNPGMARFVLKLLEDLKSFRNHCFILRHEESEMELAQGDQRLAAITQFRGLLDLPNESMEELFDSLEGNSRDTQFFNDRSHLPFGIYHCSVRSSA